LTAAAHGDADGSFFYAHALDFGVAGARDHALARAWYEKVRIMRSAVARRTQDTML
jgi:TPR repeat protein